MRPSEVQHYQVESGKLFAGEYPASWDPELAVKRLEFVIEKGVQTFINLTMKHDRLEPYTDHLSSMGGDLKHLAFPIPDMGAPESDEVMRSILRSIEVENGAGRVCYVHCWGGIGRTGTVVGCYFRQQGIDADESLKKVQKLYSEGMPKVVRHPHSPQTREQCEYVMHWGR